MLLILYFCTVVIMMMMNVPFIFAAHHRRRNRNCNNNGIANVLVITVVDITIMIFTLPLPQALLIMAYYAFHIITALFVLFQVSGGGVAGAAEKGQQGTAEGQCREELGSAVVVREGKREAAGEMGRGFVREVLRVSGTRD